MKLTARLFAVLFVVLSATCPSVAAAQLLTTGVGPGGSGAPTPPPPTSSQFFYPVGTNLMLIAAAAS